MTTTETTTARCSFLDSVFVRGCSRPARPGSTLCWYHDPELAAARERTSRERHAADRALTDAVVTERAAVKAAGDVLLAYASHEGADEHAALLDAAYALRVAREALDAARTRWNELRAAAVAARLAR